MSRRTTSDEQWGRGLLDVEGGTKMQRQQYYSSGVGGERRHWNVSREPDTSAPEAARAVYGLGRSSASPTS